MRIEDTVARIRECGLVAVVRGVGPSALEKTLTALMEGGVECFEITMSVRGALREITLLKVELREKVLIGAGEVLNSEMAMLASAAQADFCTGPTVSEEMIKFANGRDFLAIPGALTPTEIQHAWHVGSPIIKLFPANVFGPDYITTIHRPFPGVAFMPSGGITPENAPEFLKAGAVAVAAGTSIVDLAAVAAGDFETVTRNAARMVAAVRAARQ
jgi:2-dehydro-3-deoxyphosphogluconate aldolase / (4S)-4-hydroxy-2-oxoglutarate aldolase